MEKDSKYQKSLKELEQIKEQQRILESDYIFQAQFYTQQNLAGKQVEFTLYEQYFTIQEKNSNLQKIIYDDTMRLNFLLNENSKIDKNNGHLENCIGFQIFRTDEAEQQEQIIKQEQTQNSILQNTNPNNQTTDQLQTNRVSDNLNSFNSNLVPSNVSLMNFLSKDLIFHFDRSQSHLSVLGIVTTLYTTKKQDLIQLYKYLKSKILMTNFHRQYRAIRKIGKGAFASVYLVSNRDFQKQYAVKLFQKQQLAQDQDGIKGFFNEMHIMQQINHPHAIKLHEVWESKNSFYYVLDYIKYESLLEKILMHRRIITKTNSRKDKVMVNSEIKEITRQILSALVELNKHNIIHRDVKPDNILLRSKKSVDCVLSDFGLAQKIKQGEPYMYPKCGTPGYVAPEIINLENDELEKANYGTKCDVFSLGCILYFMLVLEPPFGMKSAAHVIKNNKRCFINYQNVRFLSLNKNAKDLIKQMLQKDPNLRPTAQECLHHKYFEFDEFEDDEESIPGDSPVNINNKKNRLINNFNYNVFNINSEGMKNQKQEFIIKLFDSFKYPKIQPKQTSLVMGKNNNFNKNLMQKELSQGQPPSIEELLEDQTYLDNDPELDALFPKTSKEICKKSSSKKDNNQTEYNGKDKSLEDLDNYFYDKNNNQDQLKKQNKQIQNDNPLLDLMPETKI